MPGHSAHTRTELRALGALLTNSVQDSGGSAVPTFLSYLHCRTLWIVSRLLSSSIWWRKEPLLQDFVFTPSTAKDERRSPTGCLLSVQHRAGQARWHSSLDSMGELARPAGTPCWTPWESWPGPLMPSVDVPVAPLISFSSLQVSTTPCSGISTFPLTALLVQEFCWLPAPLILLLLESCPMASLGRCS